MDEEIILVKKKDKKKNNKNFVLSIIGLVLIVGITFGVTYAFFNYTRVGEENQISTGVILFDYQEGATLQLTNQFPISETELTDDYKLSFSVSGHNTLENGVTFNIYAVHGDDVEGKTWLTDNIMKMKFVAPANGDGFSITNNYYENATTPTYTDGKALIATGLIKDTEELTTKNYSLYVWVDESLAFVSSTTKRANNLEGNPSMADATSGNVTASRYMKNSNVATNVTLYPANADSTGKIIYTTNEFSNAHYTIRIRIEANETKNN